MQSNLDNLGAVRVVARTPRNLAPILDAGATQTLRRLLHDTFASFFIKFLPDSPGGPKKYAHEVASLLRLYFTLVSLAKDGGTIGESLYWIARHNLVKPGQSQSGPDEDPEARRRFRRCVWAAAVHVAGPYLDARLAELRDMAEEELNMRRQVRAMEAEGSRQSPPRAMSGYTSPASVAGYEYSLPLSSDRIKELGLAAFVAIHPYAKLALGLRDVAARVAFSAGLSRASTLEHLLTGSRVRRLTGREAEGLRSDREARRSRALMEASSRGGGWPSWIKTKALRAKHLSEDWNKALLALVAVGCKGLEWWYSSGEEASKESRAEALDLPAPPRPSTERRLPKSSRLCPICRREKKDPAVLTASGFVFCYACVMSHVKDSGTCPVTDAPASEAHVRRLYFTS